MATALAPVESARSAGLRHVSDRSPGIQRKASSQGFRYYRPDENSPNVSISYYAKGQLVGFLLDARIRRAKVEKVPYVLVVGDDDVEHGTVGVNHRGSEQPERGVAVDAFVTRLAAEVTGRA